MRPLSLLRGLRILLCTSVLLLRDVRPFSPTRPSIRGGPYGGIDLLQKTLSGHPRHDASGIKTTRQFSTSKPMEDTSSLAKTKVLYQKVVRPSKDLPELLFLGYLVEYLESHFQLPKNLPMVYESLPGSEQDRTILAWDSPLSPAAEATRLQVEVVGIYTDDKKGTTAQSSSEEKPSVPNMAMVVVRKAKLEASSPLPAMMQGLFADSEQRILKALDRGLEDFVAGKIRFDTPPSPPSKIPNVQTAEQALEVEAVESIPKKSSVPADEVVVDAYATSAEPTKAATPPPPAATTPKRQKSKKATPSADQVAAARATLKVQAAIAKVQNNSKQKSKEGTMTEDFAVAAARKASKQKKSKESTMTEDFAVAAARKASKQKKSKESTMTEDFAVAAARKAAKQKKKVKVKKASTTATKVKQAVASASATSTRQRQQQQQQPVTVTEEPFRPEEGFKVSDYMGDQRAFRTTISRPADRIQKKKMPRGTSSTVSVNGVSSKPKSSSAPPKHKAKTASSNKNAAKDTIEKKMKKSIEQKGRNLNVKVFNHDGEGKDKSLEPTSLSDRLSEESVNKKMPSDEQLQMDIMKAAQDVMGEMVDQEEEMTPEELLRDVLKFGDEKDKENEAGSGFVSGAFEKAKDLMREQHKQRQAKLHQDQQLGFKEPNPVQDILPDLPIEVPEEISEEEELRRMFAAGEEIASGRIVEVNPGEGYPLSKTGTTQEDIDELIAKDRSISSYARVLDDELAELELSINPTPGEEFDGPQQNPIFDVFSGPEVYDPNVDLDAVNYPGALPGTKDINLPKELQDAVRQAEFAVDVLTRLTVVEKDDGVGGTRETYFVGEKEISQSQIDNLRMAVAEATEIGLITDPVNLMAEQSRLQMIIDELRNQPQERFRDIADSYKDLLLSDNFVNLIKERLVRMADRDLEALRQDDESLREPHEKEREILGQLVVYAQLLLKQARALGAELESQQLEIVRSICQVAMDPRHETEEDTATALTDAVRDMRPLLDDVFVAYIKYAVAEEEARLARAGLLDDPEHNQWLFVLQIVQQGVYAEIARGISRHVDHIGYVLRMESPRQRRKLLSDLIDDMPTMDVRPFVQVVDNIVGALGDSTRGEFDGVAPMGEMTKQLLQLRRDVEELLPPERIAEKSRDADEWAERQKQRLTDARKARNKRLQAARDVSSRQDEIEAVGRRGEIERID